ncbi:MAG: hypothetical protein WC932_00660 [archaeon]|jgi:hypothetical protein
MGKIISNYIKYKFIFNNNINHSAYLYQKVFRSIYGYTQNVTKKDKKTYLYHREGVLENIPYIKSGKNSIVIPIDTEHSIINFFNTGKSPIHNFREKGEWTIDYTIEKVEIDDTDIIRNIDSYIDSLVIISLDGNNKKLLDELNKLITDSEYLSKYKKANKDNLINKMKIIQNIDWIIKCKDKSEKVKLFYELYNKVNELFYSSSKIIDPSNKVEDNV